RTPTRRSPRPAPRADSAPTGPPRTRRSSRAGTAALPRRPGWPRIRCPATGRRSRPGSQVRHPAPPGTVGFEYRDQFLATVPPQPPQLRVVRQPDAVHLELGDDVVGLARREPVAPERWTFDHPALHRTHAGLVLTAVRNAVQVRPERQPAQHERLVGLRLERRPGIPEPQRL